MSPSSQSSNTSQHPIPVPRVFNIQFPLLPKIPESGNGPDPALARLSLNESPLCPSPNAIAAAQQALEWGHRYPDHHCTALAAELSARTGVATDCITFGNGSGELLVQAALIALEPGDEAVMPYPTFPTCGKGVQLAGGRIVEVPVRLDGTNDVRTMIAAITPRTRLFYICTPNNPTGGALGADDLTRAITQVPETCLLVIDEAYFEFSAFEGCPDVFSLLRERKGPWVVTRTFSKAYCLAGLRIGYALTSSPELNIGFIRQRNNFNVTRPSQAAALAALRDDAHLTNVVSRTVAERQYLHGELKRLGAEILPSTANFLTITLPGSAAPAMEALQGAGVAVQLLRWPDDRGALRITIGTRAEHNRLITILTEGGYFP